MLNFGFCQAGNHKQPATQADQTILTQKTAPLQTDLKEKMKNFTLREVEDPNVFTEYWDPEFYCKPNYFQLSGIVNAKPENPTLFP